MTEAAIANNRMTNSGDFRRVLIGWGREHFRPFEWRMTKDPYRILVAEVMLHRTQACQVRPVYEQFIVRFPSAAVLAASTREELYDALHPLGLRWRIDLMHEMALEMVTSFGGSVPQEKADLLSLKGVGDYIASAVRCFAWNLPEPLIDTNTVRIVGRLWGLETRDSSRRNRRFQELIAALVDPEEPRLYNYAMLDLADQVCIKGRPPDCLRCPISMYCLHGTTVLGDPNTILSNEEING